MSWLIALAAGTVTGILSAFGIGGGSLLLIYLTAFAGLSQHQAQGINLLYFLPTAACALVFHIKNRLIRWRVVIPAAITGCLTAAGAAFLATAIDATLLRKLFGGFLLLVGLNEIFGGHARDKKDK